MVQVLPSADGAAVESRLLGGGPVEGQHHLLQHWVAYPAVLQLSELLCAGQLGCMRVLTLRGARCRADLLVLGTPSAQRWSSAAATAVATAEGPLLLLTVEEPLCLTEFCS